MERRGGRGHGGMSSWSHEWIGSVHYWFYSDVNWKYWTEVSSSLAEASFWPEYCLCKQLKFWQDCAFACTHILLAFFLLVLAHFILQLYSSAVHHHYTLVKCIAIVLFCSITNVLSYRASPLYFSLCITIELFCNTSPLFSPIILSCSASPLYFPAMHHH